VGLLGEPISVLGDFGEDAGLSRAGARSERHDSDDIIGARTVGADEGSAGVSHAGRPFAGLAESNNVVGKAVVLSPQLRSAPDAAGDLLELIGEGLRVTSDQSPSGEHAVLVVAVVLASSGQASGSSIRSGEVDWFGELHESDVVVELFWVVVSLVNVDLGNVHVNFGAITSLQLPLAGTDFVHAGVLGLSEAMGSAENVLVSDEGSSANVSVSSETEGDLPRELAVSGINTVDDTAPTSLLAASFKSRCGGDQNQKQADSLHLESVCFTI